MFVRKNDQKLEDVYDVNKSAVLGRGACGCVCVVQKKVDGSKFAMKTIDLDGASMAEMRAEIEVQKSLDHPNIAKLFEYFEDHKKMQMHIIMELCTGGALVSRMKNHRYGYSEAAAAKLVEKMLSAVMYCHHRGVVHRDIKLDNFIYETCDEDSELKLIDFGFACQVRPGKEAMWEQIGTPSYMAPELWADHAKMYDSSVDIWALGVVTYMLLSGKRPFHHQDRKEKARMIMYDSLRFSGAEWDKLADGGSMAIDFCTKMMQKQPKK
jgi:calcium-dependent protein kinase|tara:strand:+ start:86 stop:886 length:801 start_codon:yes stop_codon:yes gene_type:complete